MKKPKRTNLKKLDTEFIRNETKFYERKAKEFLNTVSIPVIIQCTFGA